MIFLARREICTVVLLQLSVAIPTDTVLFNYEIVVEDSSVGPAKRRKSVDNVPITDNKEWQIRSCGLFLPHLFSLREQLSKWQALS